MLALISSRALWVQGDKLAHPLPSDVADVDSSREGINRAPTGVRIQSFWILSLDEWYWDTIFSRFPEGHHRGMSFDIF